MRVGIVGATGAVGEEIIKCLHQRKFPFESLTLLSSKRSANKFLHFDEHTFQKLGVFEEPAQDRRLTSYLIEECTEDSFRDLDVVFFSAGSGISKQFIPAAGREGCFVIDNSSAYRRDNIIPLLVPEINGNVLKNNKLRNTSKEDRKKQVQGEEGWKNLVVANPNCVTIILTTAVYPLHSQRPIERLVVSTYQSASGAGAPGMNELKQQAIDWARDGDNFKPVTDFFGRQYIWNVFSHNSDIEKNGYNGEEEKVIYETRKLLGTTVNVTATCVRVPVITAHTESVNIQFSGDEPVSEEWVRETMEKAPSVKLLDDRENNRFPEPVIAMGGDDVWVGRIRRDISQPKGNGIELFISGDQLRKGAALNAVQSAELLLN